MENISQFFSIWQKLKVTVSTLFTAPRDFKFSENFFSPTATLEQILPHYGVKKWQITLRWATYTQCNVYVLCLSIEPMTFWKTSIHTNLSGEDCNVILCFLGQVRQAEVVHQRILHGVRKTSSGDNASSWALSPWGMSMNTCPKSWMSNWMHQLLNWVL